MSLLDNIESRFTSVAEVVLTDAEKAAHSQIGQVLVDAAKVILPLIPEGGEAELVLTKLQEVEAWAHRALVAGAGVASTVETVAGDAAQVAGEAAQATAPPAA